MTIRRIDLRSQAISRRVALRAAGAGAFAGLAGVTGLAATHQATPASTAATPIPAAAPPAPAEVPIDHIIIFFSENRTFDNLYGLFAGANGIVHPGAAVPQVDLEGRVYDTLPPVSNPYPGPPVVDDRFPADLPNAPFLLDQFAPIAEEVPSPQHRFYQHQLQLNGGRMDRYVAWSETGGLPMGFHDTTRLPLYPYAREYTLADAFFTGAFGGSMLNHFWLIAAATPVWPDAPADIVAKPEFAANGTLAGLPKDGDVTPDGFVINNVQPWYHPFKEGTPDSHRMPPQTGATIGDLLTDAGRTWAWYAGGWNDALAGDPAATFEFHHQPFVYYERYADGTEAKAEHLRDEEDFLAAVDADTLPDVAFVKPLGIYDEHAGYSTVAASERHVVDLIERVKASPAWERTAIVVSYDDFGGWYDHVMPPPIDRWGPGGRVPTLIVSPHAKKGFVDHTPYDHASILKLIEWRFDLPPLTARDAAVTNMLAAFDFSG